MQYNYRVESQNKPKSISDSNYIYVIVITSRLCSAIQEDGQKDSYNTYKKKAHF